MNNISNIGVYTSGGDAPGMNAAIRAVVKTALFNKIEVTGIRLGYEGMITGDMHAMTPKSVGNIIHRGGTILKTARSEEFRTEAGKQKAYKQLKRFGIDALVAIGGDGTFTGANMFSELFDVPVIGIPATIDNDLKGTDFTIGYDTALNTVLKSVDQIRDTAESHDRLFIVEVMGRDSGMIAMRAGIAAGAEAVMLPEIKNNLEPVFQKLEDSRHHKSSKILIVAEGQEIGGGFEIGRIIKERFPQYDTRVSVLGHMQRGGHPSCTDRVLASRFGVAAVEGLLQGRSQEMVGVRHHDIVYVPLKEAILQPSELDLNMLKIIDVLA
ncbi:MULTISPECIES: 6-phosphofructokinase [unclassified Mucilaginibacter]|uniref:6-phosphofructokinase n=1 Tax=unclassified Mucilaginibacter TaxID=2617802 RepID=UPI0031F67188